MRVPRVHSHAEDSRAACVSVAARTCDVLSYFLVQLKPKLKLGVCCQLDCAANVRCSKGVCMERGRSSKRLWRSPRITFFFFFFGRTAVLMASKKEKSKSGTTPYPRRASASAPPKERKEGGQRRVTREEGGNERWRKFAHSKLKQESIAVL
jgi:hypothetical protein